MVQGGRLPPSNSPSSCQATTGRLRRWHRARRGGDERGRGRNTRVGAADAPSAQLARSTRPRQSAATPVSLLAALLMLVTHPWWRWWRSLTRAAGGERNAGAAPKWPGLFLSLLAFPRPHSQRREEGRMRVLPRGWRGRRTCVGEENTLSAFRCDAAGSLSPFFSVPKFLLLLKQLESFYTRGGTLLVTAHTISRDTQAHQGTTQ